MRCTVGEREPAADGTVSFLACEPEYVFERAAVMLHERIHHGDSESAHLIDLPNSSSGFTESGVPPARP